MFSSRDNNLQEYNVKLFISAESIKLKRSEILWGYPSLISFFSFVTNILYKAELYESPPEFMLSIEEFEFTSKQGLYSEQKAGKTVIPRISDTGSGKIKFRILFKFKSSKILIKKELEKLIAYTIEKLRFQSGFIKASYVEVLESDITSEKWRLMPGYFFEMGDNSVKCIPDLLNRVTTPNSPEELIISGYHMISNKSPTAEGKYHSVYGEAIYDIVNVRALNKMNAKAVPLFKLLEAHNYIKIKGETI